MSLLFVHCHYLVAPHIVSILLIILYQKSVIVNNDSYQKYTNEHFAITMLLFGDFMYAHEMKQYKKIQKINQ